MSNNKNMIIVLIYNILTKLCKIIQNKLFNPSLSANTGVNQVVTRFTPFFTPFSEYYSHFFIIYLTHYC